MSRDPHNPPDDPTPPPVSKSQRKREALAIKAVGERMVLLSTEQLDRLDLDQPLRNAVIEARRLNLGGARKRQIQYIGKLLRSRDMEEINKLIEQADQRSRGNLLQFHKLERWREGLLANDRIVLDELYRHHTDVDRQHLNHLVRQAQRERESGGEGTAHYRSLFRFLKSLEESHSDIG